MEQNGHRAGLSTIRNKENVDNSRKQKSNDRCKRSKQTSVAIQLALLLIAFAVGVLGSCGGFIQLINNSWKSNPMMRAIGVVTPWLLVFAVAFWLGYFTSEASRRTSLDAMNDIIKHEYEGYLDGLDSSIPDRNVGSSISSFDSGEQVKRAGNGS